MRDILPWQWASRRMKERWKVNIGWRQLDKNSAWQEVILPESSPGFWSFEIHRPARSNRWCMSQKSVIIFLIWIYLNPIAWMSADTSWHQSDSLRRTVKLINPACRCGSRNNNPTKRAKVGIRRSSLKRGNKDRDMTNWRKSLCQACGDRTGHGYFDQNWSTWRTWWRSIMVLSARTISGQMQRRSNFGSDARPWSIPV